MIVIEESPKPNILSTEQTELCVERTDISFEDVGPDKVRIQVTVHNPTFHRSNPTAMRLEAAPLGAFVPWQPLALVSVPALEPGESRELSIEVTRPRPAALGDFDRVPPRKLLTAVDSPEQPSPPTAAGFLAMLGLLRSRRTVGAPGSSSPAALATLPPDLLELVGREQPHWAGNINVFIGAHPVERHMAKALRVYAGRTNIAIFMVGEPRKRDAYAFELVGLSSDWKALLYDVSNNRTLMADPLAQALPEQKWVESQGGIVLLATQPPVGCEAGNLEVHVTRRSCGKTAIVEFNLDPNAQGAGCYVL